MYFICIKLIFIYQNITKEDLDLKDSLNYADLCQAFYSKSKKNSGFKHMTSQAKNAEFIIKSALKEESWEILPTSTASYNKWFSGENKQDQSILDAIQNDLPSRIDEFTNTFSAELNQDNIYDCAGRLGIALVEGIEIDIYRFSNAIAKQLLLIASNQGESKNQIPTYYVQSQPSSSYSAYKSKSIARYNVMKFIGGNEVALSEYYVCNTLGDKAVTKNERFNYKGVCLDNATIEKIRTLYSKRGFDNKKTILIGSGGCGKSLMLQHLFLDGLSKYPQSSSLPIFLELRNFKQSDSIESFIYETIKVKDTTLTEPILHQMLLDGKCVLLMDGFDEIDPSDINDFQKKLNDFTDQYNDVQVILASRQCDSIRGLNQYIKLYVWPFDSKQTESLISTIIENTQSTTTVEEITNFLNDGFLKKDGIFASHPMLLSYITINHDKIPSFTNDHLLFYRATYDALLTGHDDNKKPYDRVFHSVDNADQFSTVFREFCALTYKKGVFSFDSSSFDQYFNELVSYKEFENTHKMTSTAFKHDACSTACIMFEEELEIWYIDPGFQEFLFAEYYSQASAEEILELQKSLSILPLTKLERFDALDMLRKCSEEKFKFYILLPYLESIFKGDDTYAFMRFLENAFNSINITSINEGTRDLYLTTGDFKKVLYPVVENHPKTILLNYITNQLGLQIENDYSLYSLNSIDPHEFINEESEITGVLIGRANTFDGSPVLEISCEPLHVYEYLNKELSDGNSNNYYVAEDNTLTQFGVRVAIDSFYLNIEPEKYSSLVTNIEKNSVNTYNIFSKMKAYYKKLRIDKHHSGL